MQRYVLLLLFVLLNLNKGAAQITADFPDSNYYWNERQYYASSDEPCPYENIYGTIYDKGDTVVNNKVYRKLYFRYKFISTVGCNSPQYIRSSYNDDVLICLLRNDKANKKVYAIRRFNVPNPWGYPINDSLEQLLYDFSLQKGDSFVSEVYRPNFGVDYNYVRNVDTIIDPIGISRAVYYIGDTSMYYSGFVFIQGIGFTGGLLRPSIPWGFNNDGKMHCFSFDDSTAFSIPYDVNSDSSEIWLFRDTTCKEQFFTGVSQQRKQSIQLYPNPVSNAAFIKLNSEPLQLKIINNLGQVCDATYRRQDLETFKIQTETLPPGIYTLLLETVNGPSHVRFQKE